jgi:hypothetical protein
VLDNYLPDINKWRITQFLDCSTSVTPVGTLPTNLVTSEFFNSAALKLYDKGYAEFWDVTNNGCEVKSCALTVWDGTSCTSTALPANTLYLQNDPSPTDPWKPFIYRNTAGGWGPHLACYKCLYGGKDASDT